jgi:hypothetical protein
MVWYGMVWYGTDGSGAVASAWNCMGVRVEGFGVGAFGIGRMRARGRRARAMMAEAEGPSSPRGLAGCSEGQPHAWRGAAARAPNVKARRRARGGARPPEHEQQRQCKCADVEQPLRRRRQVGPPHPRHRGRERAARERGLVGADGGGYCEDVSQGRQQAAHDAALQDALGGGRGADACWRANVEVGWGGSAARGIGAAQGLAVKGGSRSQGKRAPQAPCMWRE